MFFQKNGGSNVLRKVGVIWYWIKICFVVGAECFLQPWRTSEKYTLGAMDALSIRIQRRFFESLSWGLQQVWHALPFHSRGSFETGVMYCLTVMNSLLKPLNSHILRYFWRVSYKPSHLKKWSLLFSYKNWRPHFWKKMVLNDTGKFIFVEDTRNYVGYHVRFLYMLLADNWSRSTVIY